MMYFDVMYILLAFDFASMLNILYSRKSTGLSMLAKLAI